MHTLPAAAQREVYETYCVPESRLVGRGSTTKAARVDFAAPHAPLLMLAGELDRIVPAKLNQANFARYSHEGSLRELRLLPERTHVVLGQDGWQAICDTTADWLDAKAGLRGRVRARAA